MEIDEDDKDVEEIKSIEDIKFSSSLESFMSLLKGSVGIAILDLPYVANKTGYLLSSILICMVGILSARY